MVRVGVGVFQFGRDISRHQTTCVQTAKAGAKPEPHWGGGGGGFGGMLPREIFKNQMRLYIFWCILGT